MTPRNSIFALSNGLVVSLESLKQWAVYGDLLEGLPTRRMNDATLARLIQEAEARDGHAPFLIPPVQEAIAYDGRYPFGEPARLPSIGCIGRFRSPFPARDRSKDCSELTVIWFQDEYAFPLPDEVDRAIVNVDWNALALDYEI